MRRVGRTGRSGLPGQRDSGVAHGAGHREGARAARGDRDRGAHVARYPWLGLLDAVPDSEILKYADPDDRNGDGISGRPNRFVDGRLGRFGRKAFVPTLREFNAGAFQVEIGITNPSVPAEGTVAGNPLPAGTDPAPDPELSARGLELADAFVRLLAPPAPLKQSRAARRGREVFAQVGCTGCHVPTLRTGDNPIPALRYKDVAAYTDLLLHDMGPERGDICFGLATPSEFRTSR